MDVHARHATALRARDGAWTKNDRHGVFIALLGDRLMSRYTDGGPALHAKPVKHARGRVGAGGRFARTVRRRRTRGQT